MACWSVNVERKPEFTDNRLSGPTGVAVGVKDKIYFFNNKFESFGPLDVQVFQTDNYQWRFLRNENDSIFNESLPYQIRWRTAVAYKDLVYLFADINEESWNLHCYDTSSNQWSKPIVTGTMPPAIPDFSGLSTCVINDAIYTFGSFDERNVSLYAQKVYKLDLKSWKWSHITTTGQTPLYRFGHSTTAIKNSMFIYGGCGDEGIFYDDVISLDTETMTWVTHEVNGYRPVGRLGHSAVCYKGSLLVFGGTSSDHKEACNRFMRYHPDSRRWSQVETKGNGPCSRFHHSCVLIQDRVFVFGGFHRPTPVYRNYPDHLDNIHACDFAPTLKTMSTVAVLEHKLDQKGLPETIRSDIKLTNPEEFQSGNNDE